MDAPINFLSMIGNTIEDLASQLITRTLEHAFQRRKWRILLQFARHRRLALTIRDEIADVTHDLLR